MQPAGRDNEALSRQGSHGDPALLMLQELESRLAASDGGQDKEGTQDSCEAEYPFVPQPQSLEELGVSSDLVAELALKEIFFGNRATGVEVSHALATNYAIVRDALDYLRRATLIDRIGSDGPMEQLNVYALTASGRDKVDEILLRSRYRGPVPVPFDQYCRVVKQQPLRKHLVTPDELRQGLSHLVFDQKILDVLGPALRSGDSIFLYGPPGNGKTSLATSLGRILGRHQLIPQAVTANGQIIKVFDPAIHEALTPADVSHLRMPFSFRDYDGPEHRRDPRWVPCVRPSIVVGGEVTMDRLDLTYDDHLCYHLAPLQMKANGGILVIDDFGRQRVPPADMLNRWIVPMDRGVDYLALRTGETIELPFDLLLVFATNLRPTDLVDEAYLRRLRYKILISNPKEDEYREIFRRAAAKRQLVVDEDLLDYFIGRYYKKAGREMRAYHPIDVMGYVGDISRYQGQPPHLSREILDLAADCLF